jgi:hypothetical protein
MFSNSNRTHPSYVEVEDGVDEVMPLPNRTTFSDSLDDDE